MISMDHFIEETKAHYPSKAAAARAIGELFAALAAALAAGETVRLPQVGILKPKATAARTARNPRTGEAIAVPARTKIAFTPLAELKAKLNG